VGRDWVHLALRPILAYCTSPGWWWLWSNRWNEDWQGKPKYSEKTCPSGTLPKTNPTWSDTGSNPGRRDGNQRVTAWTMARPLSSGLTTSFSRRNQLIICQICYLQHLLPSSEAQGFPTFVLLLQPCHSLNIAACCNRLKSQCNTNKHYNHISVFSTIKTRPLTESQHLYPQHLLLYLHLEVQHLSHSIQVKYNRSHSLYEERRPGFSRREQRRENMDESIR
jgi:hypothetical protein